MTINNMYDLLRFKTEIEAMGLEIPDNFVIVSPDIVDEAMSVATNIPPNPLCDMRIYGIRIVREFAEVIS
jgi:hypothetical protein